MISMKTIDLLGMSGVLGLVFGISWGFVQPQWQRHTALRAQEQVLQQQVDLSPQLQAGFAHQQAEVRAIEQRLSAFDLQLPQDVQLETFLRQLDDIAQRTGFIMTQLQPGQLQPGQLQPGELYSILPIAITAEASFPVLYAFLAALSDIPRLTNIDALTVGRKAEQLVCDVTFTLLIYVAKSTRES
jgi:Tfp pilus assembly protein PilO